MLEKRYPGISRVARDETGKFILPDISAAELAGILKECENEAGCN